MSHANFIPHLNSFDLYVKHPPGSVLETDVFEDNCSGMNPCYYLKQGNRIQVSSSVVSLIRYSGRFEVNQGFKPPQFFLHPWQKNSLVFLRQIYYSLEKILCDTPILKNPAVQKLRSAAPAEMKTFLWDPHYSAYQTNETVDSRINKVKSFETVSIYSNYISKKKSDLTLVNLDDYLEKSSYYIKKSINDLEIACPDKKHIILMGGKDSQLISLIPKINDENWYVFSASPNDAIVTKWLAQNNVRVAQVYSHNGRNEETRDDFKEKLICSDLYTNLIHIRYAPTLRKLARRFDNQCIFWLGSMPRRTSLYDASHRPAGMSISVEQFFNVHLNTFPGWQGNIQQTYSNYVGCPFLTPYYLNEIWQEVYFHLDPAIISGGEDLRPRLGEMLAGRKIHWPDRNPGPTPYQYWYFWFNVYRYYMSYIKQHLN